jgi:hypothetical protein
MLRMKVPTGGFEGYRVYVHNKLGYSGNAKRFKQGILSLTFRYRIVPYLNSLKDPMLESVPLS